MIDLFPSMGWRAFALGAVVLLTACGSRSGASSEPTEQGRIVECDEVVVAQGKCFATMGRVAVEAAQERTAAMRASLDAAMTTSDPAARAKLRATCAANLAKLTASCR